MATAEQAPGNRARLIARFGPTAGPWYDALPTLVATLADRWGLDVGEAGGGGTSRVYRCLRHAGGEGGGAANGDAHGSADGAADGDADRYADDAADGDEGSATVWLKLTPDPVVAAQEAEALDAWAGAPSVVRLLDSDLAAGALLLAGVEPGTRVREHGWPTADIARLLTDLRTAPRRRAPQARPLLLPPLSDRIAFMYDMAARRGAHAPEVLARGRAAALELAGSGPADGLVHGDLHPANVLVGPGHRLVAIDPRPTLGDPDFDAADWAIDGVTDEPGLRRRIAELTPLVPGMSADRVLAWCRATAPLTTGAPGFLLTAGRASRKR
ncbi:aminoglycoside phosphotransferase family protein [Streptomyces sp. NBC_01089]|uniref:aminoglycoside phosphotransferase family protein n=1 Tax=Streptomyces sp. NBC_01089 TaxID=2903747 RepID=UPI00386F0FBC|nr:aminoglycoside phosphotransferase family protein [Streptomyces sp. NBC_01089]